MLRRKKTNFEQKMGTTQINQTRINTRASNLNVLVKVKLKINNQIAFTVLSRSFILLCNRNTRTKLSIINASEAAEFSIYRQHTLASARTMTNSSGFSLRILFSSMSAV